MHPALLASCVATQTAASAGCGTGGFDAITEWVVGLMSRLGGPGVGLAVLLENVFPPIPSELILPLAGFTAAQGRMNVIEAIIWATAGSVIGAALLYWLARLLGLARLRAAADWLPLTSSRDVDKADAWFARHGRVSVLIGRVIPIVRSLISIPAGLDRMPPLQFLGLTALGSAVWNSALVSAGYVLGNNWCEAMDVLDRFKYVVAAVLALLVIWYVVTKVRDRRRPARDDRDAEAPPE